MNTSPSLRTGSFALVDLSSGRTYLLRPGPNVIGRSRRNRVFLQGREVSRRHATLTVGESGACELSDNESRNGLFLNRSRVEDARELVPGDVLQICDVLLLFVRDGAEPWRFAWDTADNCWHGAVKLGGPRFVCVTYSPPDRVPVRDRDRDHIRNWLYWLYFGGAELWSRFRTSHTISELTHLLLADDRATLIFGDFDGATCVTIDRTGRPVSGPMRFEDGDEDFR